MKDVACENIVCLFFSESFDRSEKTRYGCANPVDQVDPPPAGESGQDVAGTAAPYPDEACQDTRACLARGGEAGDEGPLWGEATLGPRSTSPHGYPAWACKVGHKLPSCLLGRGKERRGEDNKHIHA